MIKPPYAAVLALGLLAGPLPRAAAAPKEDAAKPAMNARMVDEENKSKKKEATIEVEVKGLKLVDPASVQEKPARGQGHLHYRLDNGPIIATTATKLSFHEMSSGPHVIAVALAANDHSALGPLASFTITIP